VDQQVTLISRLRLDTRLYEFPAPVPPGKRGPKPHKGQRLPALKALGHAEGQAWHDLEVAWYGGERKRRRLCSGACLWHTPGEKPVPIRWVLVVDPDGKLRPAAFFSTDLACAPVQIIEWFVLRWNVEVTFEESRRHLGVETQRQWSERAIARTTPALLELFSLICLKAAQCPMVPSLVSVSTTAYHFGALIMASATWPIFRPKHCVTQDFMFKLGCLWGQ
jgi:hypothetical protein